MVGFGIYCPKILCIHKKNPEIVYFTIKNIKNTRVKNSNKYSWKVFAKLWKLTNSYTLISLLNVFCPTKPMLVYRYSSNFAVWTISRLYLFSFCMQWYPQWKSKSFSLIFSISIYYGSFSSCSWASQSGLQWCMIDNMKLFDVRSMLKLKKIRKVKID